MKGDFTRLTFRPENRFSRVLMQQGRVQLDADWNEAMAIVGHRLDAQVEDLIGPAGTTEGSRGFELTVRRALAFSGKSQAAVTVTDDPFRFEGREPFTFEVWLKPDAAGGPVFARTEQTGTWGYWLEVDPDGHLIFHRTEAHREHVTETIIDAFEIGDVEVVVITRHPTEQTMAARRSLRTVRRLSSSRFNHVAVVYDGSQTSIWVDEECWARHRHERPALAADGRFSIGARPQTNSVSSFAGEIGELRIWRTARAERALAHDRELDPSVRHEHLAARYTFEEGGGEVAGDSSGHRHDLRLVGVQQAAPPAWCAALWIGKGRYYVQGAVCENFADLHFERQPDYPDAQVPAVTGEPVYMLAYLDTWERHVSWLDDPSLREVALGGGDTTTRARRVWQVRLLSVQPTDESRAKSGDFPEWRHLRTSLAHRGALRATRIDTGALLDNHLYRIEIHETGRADRGTGAPYTQAPAQASSAHASATGTGAAPAAAGQSHPAAARGPVATFKWSRDNGSVVFPVASVDAAAHEVTLRHGGQDQWAIAPGDWVELGDDDTVGLNAPQALRQIVEIDYARRAVTFASLGDTPISGPISWPISGDTRKHPFLRRWDQSGDALAATNGVIAVRAGGWIELESGIQVEFDPHGPYRAGDYWLIPSRTATNGVEWPEHEGQPASQPPAGIEHGCCPLALIGIDERGPRVIRSYRRLFPPLTRVEREIVREVHHEIKRDEPHLAQEIRREVEQGIRLRVEQAIAEALAAGEVDFLRRGGTIGGHLRVDGPLRVSGEVRLDRETHVEGDLHARSIHAGLIRGRLDADLVGAEQIRPRSITRDKLAFDLEPGGPAVVGAAGFDGFRDSPDPIPGYRCLSRLWFFNPEPHWRHHHQGLSERRQIVAVGGALFVLSDEGSLWWLDPASGRLEVRRALGEAVRGFALAATAEQLYLIGGIDARGAMSRRVAQYDPRADEWQDVRPLPHPCSDLAAAALRGKLYAIGGRRRSWMGARSSAENWEYDPARDHWRACKPMSTPRSHLGLAALDDVIVALGGQRTRLGPLLGQRVVRAHEAYDPVLDTWIALPRVPLPRTALAAGALDGRVWAMGGRAPRWWGFARSAPTDTVQEFDYTLQRWRMAPAMHVPRAEFTAARARNTVYATGGIDGQPWSVQPVVSALYLFTSETAP